MSVPRVAVIGLASWDELQVVDHYPEAGSYAVVRATLEQSGGTSSNLATALARLGIPVTLAAIVGDDDEGQRIRNELVVEGVDTRHLGVRPGEPTDRATIIVSGSGDQAERTIFWRQGARLKRGDFLPIEELFAYDLVVVDVDDPDLCRLISDLPMHVSPRTRLLGTLTYLTELAPDDGLDLALRHDYLCGNERELCYVTVRSGLPAAVERLQEEMVLSQTRFAAISRGPRGCLIVDRERAVEVPAFKVEVVDTTGAGDAFAAGVALGIVERWDFQRLGRFANGLGACCVRRLGARAGLPRRAEVEALLAGAATSGAMS